MTLPAAAPVVDRLPLALLVDNDADTRHMYSTHLQQATCLVEEAEDGREALAKAITLHPAIIITETRLPGLDGFELCRLLRRDESTRSIPVVFVTGDAFDREISYAEASGVDVVLIKPCLPERLAAEILHVLTSQEHYHRGADMCERTPHSFGKPQPGRAGASSRRTSASRAFQRHTTTEPAELPPKLVCPECDTPLRYLNSHIGGVSARHPEQWDYFECSAGCGTFQYRQRTRKLRVVV